MRFLIAPDKFKGCLKAVDVAGAIAAGVVDAGGEAQVLPLADGGDGSVDAALAAGFERVDVEARGPLGDTHQTYFAFRRASFDGVDGRGVGSATSTDAAALRRDGAAVDRAEVRDEEDAPSSDGATAVVEVANACGMALVEQGELQPLRASSAGLGDVILAAAQHGADRVVIGLGGSASTDGGLGLLKSLGALAQDAEGNAVSGEGGGLLSLAQLDIGPVASLPKLVVACDVEAPLFGASGAAQVFAPQKGADAEQVAELDDALRRLAELSGRPDLAEHPGAGAAGGLGFALLLLGASIKPGAQYFLDLLGFDAAAAEADAVVTGEGRFDDQTLMGKLPIAVAHRSLGKPVHLVCGQDASTDVDAAGRVFTSVTALSQLTERDTSHDPALTQRLLRDVGRRLATAT